MPPEFICPISRDVMRDPVVLVACGHTFDRASIEAWARTHSTCPTCRAANVSSVPNFALRAVIEEHRRTQTTQRRYVAFSLDENDDDELGNDDAHPLSTAARATSAAAVAVDASEVEAFLSVLQLDQYAAAFDEHGVDDLETLRSLSESQLDRIGVKIGHQAKIAAHLRQVGPRNSSCSATAAATVAHSEPGSLTSLFDSPSSSARSLAHAAPRSKSEPTWKLLIKDYVLGVLTIAELERKYDGFQKASELWHVALTFAQQHSDAALWQCVIGTCHFWGRGGVSQDKLAAVHWFQRSADQGFAKAQFSLGTCHLNGDGVAKNTTLAVEWFERAAEQDHAQAQCTLGVCFEAGVGVVADVARAAALFAQAADQGHADAQYYLGVAHADGAGVAQDDARAAELFARSAAQGNVDAQFALGTYYDRGVGVAHSDRHAVHWYRCAADRGHVTAQFNLGVCYANGAGVVRDMQRAVELIRLAAMQGDADAAAALVRMGDADHGVGVDE